MADTSGFWDWLSGIGDTIGGWFSSDSPATGSVVTDNVPTYSTDLWNGGLYGNDGTFSNNGGLYTNPDFGGVRGSGGSSSSGGLFGGGSNNNNNSNGGGFWQHNGGDIISGLGQAALGGWAVNTNANTARDNREQQQAQFEADLALRREAMAQQAAIAAEQAAIAKKKLLEDAYTSAIAATLKGGDLKTSVLANWLQNIQTPLLRKG